MLEVNSLIDGKYRILRVIGHGGMSTVYLAMNEKVNKTWAIKEIRKSKRNNFEVVHQSLLSEIDVLKKLSHKGLPGIFDVLEYEDSYLIVMDYIEGVALSDLLSTYGAQSQSDVVSWAIQLCGVLKYLHERPQPIIYRDMKPSNIMLKKNGTLVLIDFGTAREYKIENNEDTLCLGTQGYAAPEQFGGKGQTDARTDIYCLGATMYHLVTGHNPAEPPYEMYPISQWNDELSSGLERIILKCTQKNPKDRYQSADELLYDLKHYRDLDIYAIKQFKRKAIGWGITFVASVIMMVTGTVMGIVDSNQEKNRYNNYLGMAQNAITEEDAIRNCVKAIDKNPSDRQAYERLLQLFIKDGSFTKEEEIILTQVINNEQYLKTLANSNKIAYADFCYNIGGMYWYYFDDDNKRATNTRKWIKRAMEYYKDDDTRIDEYANCEIFIDMGAFLQDLDIRKGSIKE